MRLFDKNKIVVSLFLILLCVSCSNKNKRKGSRDVKVGVTKEAKSEPNVLLIYVDQLRRYSAGFWSKPAYRDEVVGKPDPVSTPNIDFLAENGVVFSQGVANYPLCSPSRGMLLSGMYPEQNGLWNNARKDRDYTLKQELTTITDVFHNAGYHVGYFGKAHYIKPRPVFDKEGNFVNDQNSPGGYYINDYDTYVPPGRDRHNIDYFYQHVKDQHYDPLAFSSDPDLVDGKMDGKLYHPEDFSTKVESQAIVKYLKNERQERNEDKPFFLMWSINPPHSPWDEENTNMDFYHLYDNTKYPNVDSLLVRENVEKKVSQDYVRNYFTNTTAVDYYIGKVIEQLKDEGMLENTIVLFTADHGEMMGSHGLQDKNVLYTEALAVPYIFYWKNKLLPAVSDILIGTPDVLPTITGLADIKEYEPDDIDGNDLSQFIINDSVETEKPESLLLMLGNSRGIKTDEYTMVLKENKEPWDDFKGTKLEELYLFDDQNDPYQLHKISFQEKPKVAEKLLIELAAKLKRFNDPWYKERKYEDIIPYSKL